MKAYGLYRIHDSWFGLTTQDSAMVRYANGKECEVPEDEYRAQTFQPPFDSLPWKATGEAKPPRHAK